MNFTTPVRAYPSARDGVVVVRKLRSQRAAMRTVRRARRAETETFDGPEQRCCFLATWNGSQRETAVAERLPHMVQSIRDWNSYRRQATAASIRSSVASASADFSGSRRSRITRAGTPTAMQ